ncbi:MAG: transglycosylase domain-containing protein, partial [Anaerolineae bacterium]|nr:transglycosylase domain-containing protein [Anaerolineae bacterium]
MQDPERTLPNQKPPVYGQQPAPPASPMSRPSKPRRRIVQRKRRGCMPGPGCLLGCFGALGVFSIVFLIGAYLVYYQVSRRLEKRVDELEANINDVSSESGFETTFIYDRDGNKLYEVFGQGRRQWVDLEQIPEVVKQATISVEDDEFYDHPGFDLQSNVRAVWQYLRYGEVISGASTITQQLVRYIFFEPDYRAEQSVERKVDEILLATVMTQKYSKDEILELYLNEIYYGNLAYGIEAAAQTYFGKSAGELELHEAALLAGLPQFPAELNPLNDNPSIQA